MKRVLRAKEAALVERGAVYVYNSHMLVSPEVLHNPSLPPKTARGDSVAKRDPPRPYFVPGTLVTLHETVQCMENCSTN